MKTISVSVLAFAMTATDTPAQGDPVEFAAPRRIQAGDDYMGAGRLYPSPVLRDMNGDGIADIVLGDLIGKVTVALGRQGETMTFGADEPLKDHKGEQLKFHNW